MSVPIETLGLENLLTERVYIKWMDEDVCSTLGSCMPTNKKNVDIIMKVVCDSKSKRNVHVQFSLKVATKISGKRHYIHMLLAVPPHGNFEHAAEVLPIQELNDLSRLDASALQEAGISNVEHVIVLQFDIRFRGFVVQKEKESTTFCPFNKASSKLICAIRSLSCMKKFKVYIRPSDYARQHLKEIRERLRDTSAEICESDMKKIYSQQGIMPVDWTNLKQKEPRDQLPPLSNGNHTRRPTAVTRLSPDREELSDVVEDSHINDDYKDSGHVETYLEVEVNSDEEYLAESNARQLDSQYKLESIARELDEEYLADIREVSQQDATSEALGSEFREWLDAATKVNPNVLGHKGLTSKLLTLGESVRESDVAKFDAIRPWCSALLFYDPTDSSRTSELQDSTRRVLVSDIAGLIKSINTFQRGAEMTFLMDDLLKLGSAARAGDKEQYTRYKVECQFRILVDKKSSKGLSRKRNILEIGSNVYKRTRIAAVNIK